VYESFKAKYLIEKENWEKKYGQNELAEKPKKKKISSIKIINFMMHYMVLVNLNYNLIVGYYQA